MDGELLRRPARPATATCSRTAGRSGSASSTTSSPSSRRAVRERADAAIKADRRAPRRRPLPEARRDARASTPRIRSAARGWPTRSAFGVVDDRCEVFGYEGLFCMDSSVIPTSFGVNPSLSISAVCERAAAKLVARAADFGLPAPPPGLQAPAARRPHRPAREARAATRNRPRLLLPLRRPPWTTTSLEVPGRIDGPLNGSDGALPRPAGPARAPQRAVRRRRVRARAHPQGPDRGARQARARPAPRRRSSSSTRSTSRWRPASSGSRSPRSGSASSASPRSPT